LQRKVATYLPLSSFWNVRAHPSDSALTGSSPAYHTKRFSRFQPVSNSRTPFLFGAHGVGYSLLLRRRELDSCCCRGLMSHDMELQKVF
ncbi:hypothetical protein BAE44_0006800, partial [Dichanthelium oligosanthes]